MGFPSGEGLKQQIAENLTCEGGSELRRITGELFRDSDVADFTRYLTCENSASRSIDAILCEFHHQNERLLEIGRVAVWYTILEHEQRVNLDEVKEFWLWKFLDNMSGEFNRFDDLYTDGPANQTKFLYDLQINSLNYDRLVEEVVRLWFWDRFPKDERKLFAKRALSGDLVSHKHGSLGLLEGEASLPFGAPHPKDSKELLTRAKLLQFWFEPSNEAHSWNRTNRIIELRGTLLILGYGFHDHIGRRFAPVSKNDSKLRRVIITGYGLDSGKREQAHLWLDGAFRAHGGERVLLDPDIDCEGAIDHLFMH